MSQFEFLRVFLVFRLCNSSANIINDNELLCETPPVKKASELQRKNVVRLWSLELVGVVCWESFGLFSFWGFSELGADLSLETASRLSAESVWRKVAIKKGQGNREMRRRKYLCSNTVN